MLMPPAIGYCSEFCASSESASLEDCQCEHPDCCSTAYLAARVSRTPGGFGWRDRLLKSHEERNGEGSDTLVRDVWARVDIPCALRIRSTS